MQPVRRFSDVIVKDVFISGIADDEIKREVLGWSQLDEKSIEETVAYVEAKEMARTAMNRGSTAAPISNYKKKSKQSTSQRPPSIRKSGQCKECKVEIDSLIWSRRRKEMVERNFCSKCWSLKSKKPHKKEVNTVEDAEDEAGAIIGGITQQPIPISHLLFDSDNGWKKMNSMKHPTLPLTISIEPEDYSAVGRKPPIVKPKKVEVVTDTGAQSCLWGLQNFLTFRFKETDLIPVKHTLFAANKEQIPVLGAILLRLYGDSPDGNSHSAGVMVYVSPSTNRFFLSREALIQLNIIPKNFLCLVVVVVIIYFELEEYK